MPAHNANSQQFVEWHSLRCRAKISNGQRDTLYHRGVKLQDKVVVVTGGGNGIGRALCRRFAAEGAKAIVVADVEGAAARQVAIEIGSHDFCVDVSNEADVQSLVDETLKKHGRIDLFCSNAGISIEGDPWVTDRD